MNIIDRQCRWLRRCLFYTNVKSEGGQTMKGIIFCLLFGYLIGTINPAFILGRLKGFDIREEGSGNAGASNAVLLMGKAKGAFCMMFDIVKAFLAFRLARRLFPLLPIAGILSGAACILGHMFPIWMGFRGGKGLACLAGTALGYNWKTFLVLLALEVVIVLIFDYICIVAMSASVIFPLVYVGQTKDGLGMLIMGIVALLMLYKHTENVQRILEGKEVRVSYLWNREAETERLRKNYHL